MKQLVDIAGHLVEQGSNVPSAVMFFNLHRIASSPYLSFLKPNVRALTQICLEHGFSANAKLYIEGKGVSISLWSYLVTTHGLPDDYLKMFLKYQLDVTDLFPIDVCHPSEQVSLVAIAFSKDQVELARLLLNEGSDINQIYKFSVSKPNRVIGIMEKPVFTAANGQTSLLRDAEMTLRNAGIEPRALCELIERAFYTQTRAGACLTMPQLLETMFPAPLHRAVQLRLGTDRLQALDEKLGLYTFQIQCLPKFTHGDLQRKISEIIQNYWGADLRGSNFLEEKAQGCWFTFKANPSPSIRLAPCKPIKVRKIKPGVTPAQSMQSAVWWRPGFLKV